MSECSIAGMLKKWKILVIVALQKRYHYHLSVLVAYGYDFSIIPGHLCGVVSKK